MLVATAALAVAGTLVGCGGGSDGGDSNGTMFSFGTGNDTVNSLNPFAASSFEALQAMRVLYPYLLQYNVDGTSIVGDFAQEYRTSADGLTWTFTTYPNARWSDGKPLTANDAAWTFTTILKFKDGPTASLAPYVQGLTSAIATDERTLTLTYAQPLSTVANSLVQVPILPEHIWAPLAEGDGGKLSATPNLDPVTGGSFTLAKYETDKLIIFRRNPDFYGPKPIIAGYGYQTFTNTDALVDAVDSGQIHGAFDLPPAAVATLSKNSKLRVSSVPGTDVVLLGLNTNPRKTGNRSILDPVVREAIDLAIDRQNLVKTVRLGQGTAVGSILPPALTTWVDRDLEPRYDVDRANALLDGAGYRRGEDGIRSKNGEPLSFTLNYFNTVDSRLPTLLQSDLRKIGVNLVLRPSDGPGFVAAVSKNSFRDFDMSMYDYGPAFDPTTQLSIATCGQQGSLNFIGYCDKAYDALFAQQSSTIDEARRRGVVKQIQQKLSLERPVLPLYAGNSISAASVNVPVSVATPLIFPYQSKLWLSSPGQPADRRAG